MLNETVLVTGGCGFIGSAFVRQQAAAGRRVIVLDALTYAGHRENLEGLPPAQAERVELVIGDIRDGKLVADLLARNEVRWLVHFAAESHVDRSISEPSAFIETNVSGTFTLLNASLAYWQSLPAAEQTRFRYVQVSTDEVFGALGDTGKFSETTPYAPNSPYSASKAAGDLLARAWFHTYQLPVITTNCSNNYGPRQFPEKLIPHMIQCALSGRPLPVYGNGGNVRDWIHVEDHSRGVALAMEKGVPGETYCFGGDAERNNLDVVRTICKILDDLAPRSDSKPHESAIQFVTDRKGHDWRYAIDDSKAQRELGFRRRHDFSSGLRETVQWYLENQDWCRAVIVSAKSKGAQK